MRSNAVFSDIDVASAPTTSSNKNGHGSSNNSNNNKNIKKSDGDVASIPSMENHLRSDVISTASTTNGNKMNNSKNVVVGGNNPSLISNSVTGKDTITINKSDIHTTVTRNASTVLLSITGNANHHQPHIRNLLPSLNEENNVPQQQKAQQRRSFPVGSRFSSSSNHADETADKRGDPVDLLLNRPKSNVLSDWSSTNKARITSGKAGKPNKESAVASYNVSSTSEQEPTWSDMSEEMKLSLVMKEFDEVREFIIFIVGTSGVYFSLIVL